MAGLDNLKRKLGYIPDLSKIDFSVFTQIKKHDLDELIAHQNPSGEVVFKLQIYSKLQAAHSSGNTYTQHAERKGGVESFALPADIVEINGWLGLLKSLQEEINTIKLVIEHVTSAPNPAFRIPSIKRVGGELYSLIRSVARSPLCILSGGPGTGKTTLVKRFIDYANSEYKLPLDKIAVFGASNKCLSAYSELEVDVSTVHKGLGFNPFRNVFSKNKSSPLPYSLVFVEESSMMDSYVFNTLISALRPGCHLILVGDHLQLGSVGLGEPFFSLCNLSGDGLVPRIILNRCHRSVVGIINLVNTLRVSNTTPDVGEGVYFVKAHTEPVSYFSKLLKILFKFQNAGFNVMRELQILSPSYRKLGGIDDINQLLHSALTQSRYAVDVGDKVVIQKSAGGVFQGEQFVVSEISDDGMAIGVTNERLKNTTYIRHINMPRLAHCLSIHESQGSEWEHGLICINKSDLKWLGVRGVITALSRFRKTVTLYGDITLSDLLSAPPVNKSTLFSIVGHNTESLLLLIDQHRQTSAGCYTLRDS